MSRTIRILANQLKLSWEREPEENILFIADESNARSWHCLVVGLSRDFFGGEFIFKLDAPDTFPARPPSFQVLSPNGIYETNCYICISIGEFHALDYQSAKNDPHKVVGWRPSLGMVGFAKEAMGGMVYQVEDGMNVLKNPTTQGKVKASADSLSHNRQHYGEVIAMFESMADTFPSHPAVKRWRLQTSIRQQEKMAGPLHDMFGITATDTEAIAAGIPEVRDTNYIPALFVAYRGDVDKLTDSFTSWQNRKLAVPFADVYAQVRQAILMESYGHFDARDTILKQL
jgi:ubiquitin-protein ligase